MKQAQPINLTASVHQRLLNLSRQRNEDFNLLLTRYAIERLLYRLTRSPDADRFVLKGALTFAVWGMETHRPTRDLDLLGYGSSAGEDLIAVFQRMCTLEVEPDGLTFDRNSVRAQPIRVDQEYQGQRITLNAYLGKARIPQQIDIGFGDIATPRPQKAAYPTLLPFPAPLLRVYPKETVVAEKFHAMVALGALNSRVKDFYDLWAMIQELAFDGPVLAKAIQATFTRRQSALPTGMPVGLTSEFEQRPDVQVRWSAFLRRNRLVDIGTFSSVIEALIVFLVPVLSTLVNGAEFDKIWHPGGPWQEE